MNRMCIVNIEPSWRDSVEHQCLVLAGVSCRVSPRLREHAVGIGSVDYCRSIHKWPACDPYPSWLPVGRTIYRNEFVRKPLPIPNLTFTTEYVRFVPKWPLFYKPADIPKRFQSAVMDTPPPFPWVASDVIEFVDEYRAYIVEGEVLAVYKYSDFETNPYHPFPWSVDRKITAAIDFGITADGEILLVEVNDPYSIGWYGPLSNYKIYAEFVIAGWGYMMKKQPEVNENGCKHSVSARGKALLYLSI